MKTILLQFGRRAKPIRLYIDTKKPDASSRRIWLEKRNNKNMFKFLLCFIFLTMFPKNNLLYLTLTNTLELLVDFDRLLPIVINAVLSPKQKVEVDTSVIIIFVDTIRG